MSLKHDRRKIQMNGYSKGRHQHIPEGEKSVSVDEVIKLLENAATSSHTAISKAARDVLTAMAGEGWRVTAARHTGGRPDDDNPDDNQHITISVPGIGGCHLRLNGDGHIFQITLGKGDQNPVKPWQAPGTPNR